MNPTWKETLELKHALEAELRSRSEIFNPVEKEHAAEMFGQPLNTYYHLPFKEWVHVSRRMEELIDAMCRDCKAVSEWAGADLSKVAFSEWQGLYDRWLSEQ